MVGALGRAWQDTGYNHAFRIGVISVLLASALLLFAFGFRCPRCRRTLVHKAPAILMQGGTSFCPNCGVSCIRPGSKSRSDPAVALSDPAAGK